MKTKQQKKDTNRNALIEKMSMSLPQWLLTLYKRVIQGVKTCFTLSLTASQLNIELTVKYYSVIYFLINCKWYFPRKILNDIVVIVFWKTRLF